MKEWRRLNDSFVPIAAYPRVRAFEVNRDWRGLGDDYRTLCSW
jgi:hypothetical protein